MTADDVIADKTRRAPALQYELAVVTGKREYRRHFDDPRKARDAFMDAITRRPFTASVSSYDRDGNIIERIWHYDDLEDEGTP